MFMRRLFRPFFILLIVFCSSQLHLAAQDNYEVRSVDFHGNKTLDKSFLLDGMGLTEVSWLEKVLLKEQPFLYNQDLVDLDMGRPLASSTKPWVKTAL